jgi:hypothetical protein
MDQFIGRAKMVKAYMIQNNIDTDLYWSNENGYVDKQFATMFSPEEKEKYNLPVEGHWFGIRIIQRGKKRDKITDFANDIIKSERK